MNIDMEYYKFFCMVAECNNFSKAAEKLYISQPAITQTIKKLEEQLECKLFYRKSNGVCLTKEGEHLYNYVNNSVTTINNVENKFKELRGLKSGIIKIRTGNNNAKRVLYNSLMKFTKDYPNIKIQISQGKPQDSINELINGKIDIVILNLPYKNLNRNIEIIEIAENTYTFVATKEYLIQNNIKIKNIEIAYVMKCLVEKEINDGKLIEINLNKKEINSKVGVAILKDDISSFASRKLIEYMKR